MEMQINNPRVIEELKVGKYYYLDLAEVPAELPAE